MRMTGIRLLCCAALLAMASTSFGSPLVISGIFDGPLDGGEPKVVELAVCEDIADLSLYAAGAANNGGGTDGVELVLSGSASAGDFIYIVDDNSDSAAGVEFNDYFGFTPSLLFDSNAGSFGGPAAINGDDAVELFYDPSGLFAGAETVIDTFGDINAVPGSWGYADGWAYRNSFTGPDGATFVESNWAFSGADVNDGKTTNVDPSAFPIGTYQCIPEPSTVALMALALGLVGLGRRSVR